MHNGNTSLIARERPVRDPLPHTQQTATTHGKEGRRVAAVFAKCCATATEVKAKIPPETP